MKKRFIISGGGSGGHVFPALAIAEALTNRIDNVEILFVGAKGKLEMDKVPEAGYPIEGLWISGLQRSLTWKNVLFPIKLLSSLRKSYRIIRRFKPDASIGVGGYASGPLVRMSSALGIPTLIQEQNSYAGLTNRWLAKHVDIICVAYPGMEKFFPFHKLVLTGNPVRSNLSIGDRSVGMNHFSLELRKKTILVTGGSLGARTFNQAMANAHDLISEHEDVQWIWQTGRNYFSFYRRSETAQLANVQVHAFLDRMDLAYAAADLVICRAGAMTISELATIGKAALLVPSPNVSEDHQTSNAKVLADRGACQMLLDKDAEQNLVPACLKLIHEEDKRMKMKENIGLFTSANATDKIVDEVLKL